MKTQSRVSTAIKARLVLEDGSVFEGVAFGATSGTAEGEVVFNTAMCGYQESLTDPSYAGQILVMTAPEIGNYGVNDEDVESGRIQVRAFVVRELSRRVSNHRATLGLSEWLQRERIIGIEGVDTRAITRRIRSEGTLRGIVTTDESMSNEELVERARAIEPMSGCNMVQSVTPNESERRWTAGLGEWAVRSAESKADGTDTPARSFLVAAIDCGAKRNIYRHLRERGCEIVMMPADVTADEIRALNPDGLFVSNGPGDPAAVARTIEMLREIAGEVPTFGICLGHQLLALALGGTTYKLKFGHRGANQPVRNVMTGRVEITSQNHGFAVDPESLCGDGADGDAEGECELTHMHLNDGTVAGFRHRTKPIFAVQYHPEASPGPHDSMYLFELFIRMMTTGRPIETGDLEPTSVPMV